MVPFEYFAATLFAIAVLHTFLVSWFRRLAGRFPSGSIVENLFHLLGEVEVVFGLWAAVLLAAFAAHVGEDRMLNYLENASFTEPVFVFVIMAIAATRPILRLADFVVSAASRLVPLPPNVAYVFAALVVGPLLGSFITEPAAMTVTALILKDRVFVGGGNAGYKYALLGTLFVNVSIGGVLTPFAAPPVLMVAAKWKWDFAFMVAHFGWKAAVAVAINAALAVVICRKAIAGRKIEHGRSAGVPLWLCAIHVGALALVVRYAHHPAAFLGIFLLFLGVVAVTREFQDALKLRESLLVGFFLGGLVVLGGFQEWWLREVIGKLGPSSLYLGSAVLTAVTDNAALTFLGTQVPGLGASMQYALVAGSVVGGGLTVIANAPNPAGFSILQSSFGKAGISPLGLFLGALLPTLVALAAFWFLPSLAMG